MNIDQAVNPANVAGATLLMQTLLMAMLGIAVYTANQASSAIDTSNYVDYKKNNAQPIIYVTILISLLISFGVVLASEAITSLWSPLFNGVGFKPISNVTTACIVFIVDICIVSHFIWLTGGSEISPFNTVLFTLPALAIFLRLQSFIFVWCAVLATISYIILLFYFKTNHKIKGKLTPSIINISCLFISILTGYITRPNPII